MVRQGTHRRNNRTLLTTARGGRAHEHSNVLAPVGTLSPLLAGVVEEGFPLCREISVAGRNSKEESIVLFEFSGGDDGQTGFRGRMHEFEDMPR